MGIDELNLKLAEEVGEMKKAGLYKATKVLESLQGAEVTIDGKRYINFCSNNYLGLAGDKEIARVAKEGIDKYGFGMASVRFICGTSTVHKELEKEVSKFFGFEDAILYSSCFDANGGVFEALLKEGDVVFSDELNHASIIDGIALCKAERFKYKHSDLADLEQKLAAAGERRRKLIVTDGVFSMDGETAKLSEIKELSTKYSAIMMVDDSHGSGVLGARGRGSIEEAKPDILTSTFGKALGGAGGGFVAGSREVVEYLRQRSRPYLFSNTLIPAVAHAALHVLKNYDSSYINLKNELLEKIGAARGSLEGLGLRVGGDGTHPIIPVMFAGENETMEAAEKLLGRGIYVRGFTYPVVPRGKARIRVQLSAAHDREHLDSLVGAFSDIIGRNGG